MKEIDKMRAGEFYVMEDEEISRIHFEARRKMQELEGLDFDDKEGRDKILRSLFGSAGKNLSIKPGFRCDLGVNIHVGDDFLTNYGVTILDMAPVRIGNNTWLGPNVGLYAVAHPMNAAGRKRRLGIAKPITIGDNVWIGGNAVVVMGVTIGDNVIIGAGAVVTHDIPDNAVAVGNPARVIKYIDNTEIEQ